MRSIRRFLLTALPGCLAIHSVLAATIHVPADIATIQEAIDSATHEDEVVVATGTYFERIHFDGKNIVLRSIDPTDLDVVAATVIDASASWNDESSVVTFSGAEGTNCVLAGFTIQNGDTFLGGGIRGNRTGATIERNRIMQNEATSGGGIYDCDGTIRNNRIFNNRAVFAYVQGFSFDGEGGGLAKCDGSIYNNLIYDNDGDYGGAFNYCHATIEFNTLYSNSASYGKGFYNCMAYIANNIIWEGGSNTIYGSGTPVYCCIRNWSAGGTGNLSTNPRFVDAANFDFRLSPDSPCIDAGGGSDLYPSFDIENATRPYDSTSVARGDGYDYDIGAYEFIGEAEPDPAPNRPVNVSPEDGADVVGYNPLRVSSPFSDPNPADRHVRSEWQLCENDGFAVSDLVSYIWTDAEDLLQFEAFVDPKDYLEPDRTYWWRVRHLDSYEQWSEWSLATSFNTRPATEPLRVPQDFSTIQSAINHSTDGGVIVVATGTYEENLDFLEKGVALQSTDPLDATVVAQTVLKYANWFTPGILFENIWYDSRATLSGLTIHSGGEGVRCNSCNVDILNNVFTGGFLYRPNDAFKNNRIEGGSGIYEGGPDLLVEENTILAGSIRGYGLGNGPIVLNNLISGIDGTAITACHGPIRGNTITLCTGRAITSCNGLIEGNTIMYNGYGAIGECDGTIRNNTIAYNTTPGRFTDRAGIAYCDGLIACNLIFGNTTEGGGAGIGNCNGTILNNVLFDNYAREGGTSIAACDGLIANNVVFANVSSSVGAGISGCDGEIINNIVWGNVSSDGKQVYNSSDPSFCCIQNWDGSGIENISADPQFINSDNGDFRLLPSSPCVDSGAYVELAAYDYSGNPRGLDGTPETCGDGSNYDIGAYEYLGKELFHLGSDIDLSSWVDAIDLLSLLADWHSSVPSDPRSDINQDEKIDPTDLRIFLKDWQRGTGPL